MTALAVNDGDGAFDAVIPGSLVSHQASPQLDDDFRGVRLTAPRVASFDDASYDPLSGAFGRVLVCGAFQLDRGYLARDDHYLHDLFVVAVDAATHVACAGPAVLVPETYVRARGRPETGRVLRYFNSNLAAALALPAVEADYHAYAILGAYVSNVVSIAVRQRRHA
jgi:hypothetical protein